MRQEYGIFSDESADYTADEAIEAGFSSLAEAIDAMHEDYLDSIHDDGLHAHRVED